MVGIATAIKVLMVRCRPLGKGLETWHRLENSPRMIWMALNDRKLRRCELRGLLEYLSRDGQFAQVVQVAGDHQQLLDSIRDKVLPLGDETGFTCGHGPGGKIGEERRTNPFLTGI